MDDLKKKGIVAAVTTRGRQLLLIRRQVGEGKLLWAFCSGEIEEGESASDAAVRELSEELGVQATADRVLGQRTHPITGRQMTYVHCLLTDDTPEPQVLDKDEIAEFRWVDHREMDELIGASLFPPVAEFLELKLPST